MAFTAIPTFPRARPAGTVAALVVAGGTLLAACSGGLGETAGGDVRSGPGGADATRIAMQDNTFEPATVNVTAGSPVEFELTNQGAASHNFTNEALGVSTGPLQAGDVATLTATIPSGTSQFVCTWHPGMTIDVVAG